MYFVNPRAVEKISAFTLVLTSKIEETISGDIRIWDIVYIFVRSMMHENIASIFDRCAKFVRLTANLNAIDDLSFFSPFRFTQITNGKNELSFRRDESIS